MRGANSGTGTAYFTGAVTFTLVIFRGVKSNNNEHPGYNACSVNMTKYKNIIIWVCLYVYV
jgi:hypothetical protein